MNPHIPVFVCGTYTDLSAERGAVLDALQKLQVEHHSMELFGAHSQVPLATCLGEVRKSKIIVVIVGHRYGSLAPGLDVSYSEAEYNEAFARHLECLVYFRKADEKAIDYTENVLAREGLEQEINGVRSAGQPQVSSLF
jgi:hypothetical protein